jgi:hypothetical protein
MQELPLQDHEAVLSSSEDPAVLRPIPSLPRDLFKETRRETADVKRCVLDENFTPIEFHGIAQHSHQLSSQFLQIHLFFLQAFQKYAA